MSIEPSNKNLNGILKNHMKKLFLIFANILVEINIALGDSFNNSVNRGFMQGIFLCIGMALIYGIFALYRKLDNKVDDYKLERNPNNVKIIEKKYLTSLIKGDKINQTIFAEKLYQINNLNILGLSHKAISDYENRKFDESKNHLYILFTAVPNKEYLNLFSRHSGEISGQDIWKFISKNIYAKTHYYYGHLLSMENNFQEAEKFKKAAIKYSKKITEANLF